MDPMMKMEDGVNYPASCYAYVPDAKQPSTWKLRLKDASGKYDMDHLAAAAAALSPGGFRGQKVELPADAVAKVKAKIRAGYKALGKKPADLPASVTQAGGGPAETRPSRTHQAEIPNDWTLDDLREDLGDALCAKFMVTDGMLPNFFVKDIFPDRVIVATGDGDLQAIPYTLSDAGVTLGEPVAVEVQYVPDTETEPAQQARAGNDPIRIQQAIDKEGWEWEVLIIQPGMGAKRQYFPKETLQQCYSVFEGARAFCLPDKQHTEPGDDKGAPQIVGWIDQARYADGEGAKGRLNLVPTADWLRQNLLSSHKKGKRDLYGLSVDAPGEAISKTIQQNGRSMQVQWFTKILAPATVDVVWNPGTPGGFQRALNAHSPTEEDSMLKERLLTILQAKRPDLLEGKDQTALTEDEVLALYDKAMAPAPAAAAQAPAAQAQQATETAAQRVLVLDWNAHVRQALADCKLPEVMQADLRLRFMDALPAEGTEQGLAQVTQAIERERNKIDAITQSGQVRGMGFAHEVAVEGSVERLQASLDKAFGIKDVKSDAPAFTGIRQAYAVITGDQEVSGVRSRYTDEKLRSIAQSVHAYQASGIGEDGLPKAGFVRVAQAQVAASWPSILGNTLYRRMMQDYAAVSYGEDRIISNRRRATDFRNLEAVRLDYAADMPDVDPENADYTEAGALNDIDVSYAIKTVGRLMSVSRKTVINDDIGAVIKLPQREGRAARRTFARFVWNLWKNNATYDGDSKAWFHADHANLGSTALTGDGTGVTTLMAAVTRLMAQTEQGSGEVLGGAYWDVNLQMVVPQALAQIAHKLNQSPGIPGAANQGDNPCYGMFGDPAKPERILVNPLLTDATDWGLFRDPSEMDIVEVAFLNGQETPEVFVADQQTVGQMFLADKLQYKLRFEFGGDLLDFRSADKSVVAG